MNRPKHYNPQNMVSLNLINKITVGTDELQKLENLIRKKNIELSRVQEELRRLPILNDEVRQAEDALAKARAELPDALKIWISENREKLEAAREEFERDKEKLENLKVVVSADLEILSDERHEVDVARTKIKEEKFALDKHESELTLREKEVDSKVRGFQYREAEIAHRESEVAQKEESVRRQTALNDELKQRMLTEQSLFDREKIIWQQRSSELENKISAFERMAQQAPDFQRRISILESVKKDLESQQVEYKQTIAALSRKLPSTDTPGITFSETVLGQLVNNSSLCLAMLGGDVVTIGEGPIPGYKFDQFLHSCGIKVHEVGYDSGVVITGRMQWESGYLDKQIAVRQNEKIRIYSQEMLLLAMAMGGDPFDLCDYFELYELGAGHPALIYLMKSGFNWPSPNIHGGRGGVISGADWMAEGLLKHLGYTVGNKGLPESERHKILDRAMAANLSLEGKSRFGCDWGNAGQKGRLHKIAQSLATFVRLHQGMENAESYELAIEQWEIDLEWLREKYYQEWMKFRWPETSV